MEERMPLVEQLVRERAGEDLSGVSIVARQHVFAQAKCMFGNLFDLGLKPENVFVLGKCYSTNTDVMAEMRSQGIFVDDNSVAFESLRPYDDQISEHVEAFLSSVEPRITTGEVILLDSGGSLIRQWGSRSQGRRVFGVEQTSSGFHALASGNIPFPVMNVARSVIKQNVEAPYIAATFAAQLTGQIATLDVPSPRTAVVIGAGVIGRNIRKELDAKGIDARCFDLVQSRTDIHEDEFLSSLRNADIVIGTTGGQSVDLETMGILKDGVILASASSSDREINPSVRLRYPQTDDCHRNMRIVLESGKCVWLMNAGFPANFTGRRYDLPLELAQITAALLVQGMLDVRSERQPGLVEFRDSSTRQLYALIDSQEK